MSELVEHDVLIGCDAALKQPDEDIRLHLFLMTQASNESSY